MMKENRKTAKRLLLVNWSCFQNEIIRLGSSTLFTGVNGTGKTTILDAMSYLITANTQFNKAADDNARNVTAYIHGDRKTNGSDRYLRPGNVTSYIAMEFYDPLISDYHVIAVCMESRSESDRAISQWIIREKCRLEDFNFSFVNNGKLTVTSKNNLTFKNVPLKSADFFGRDKAIPQLTRQLGIRTSDYKKYKEKLLKMMAFDPERNVDKFLQTSVFAEAEVKSLDRLREQRKLYDQAKQMFANIQERKNLLEEIEQKTCDYEKIQRNYNVRQLMFRYQFINQYKQQISNLKVSLQNNQIKLQEFEEKKKVTEEKLFEMRKRLSEVENKNHSITETLDKMEQDKISLKKQIEQLENELAALKQLQVSLKLIIPQMSDYFETSDENKTVLQNLSETDFPADKKTSSFIEFSTKIKNQRDLFIEENGRIKTKLDEVTFQITEVQNRIKKLEANIRQFPREAEEAKRIIQNEFNRRGIKTQVRLFAELVESLNDESWRKSVETFLGNKRYSIIVDDEYCHEALSILNEKNLYKANVILTDKIPETEIEENSAASVLNITNKGARRYANYLLNGIVLCQNLEELHENPKGGLTKDGMICKSYSAGKMQIHKTSLCLGNDVVKIQLEQAKKEFETLNAEKSEYEKQIQDRNKLKTLIDNVDWNAERYNFNSAKEIAEKNKDFGKLFVQIEELKNSPEMLVAAKEYEPAKANLENADSQSKSIERKLGSVENEIANIERQINENAENADKAESEYKEISENHPELINEMKEEYERACKQRNSLAIISQKYLQNLANDVENAKRKMEEKQREYNQLSEIELSNYGTEFIPFYRDRYRDVANVKIDEAKNKVEKQSEKLRDVFLHDFVAELNEKIIAAKDEIAAINAELKRIPFGRDIYQFKMEEKPDRAVFFTICKNLELYSESPDLFTERTVSDEKLSDDVQSFLNKILDTDQEEDYSDYRNYFTYDMTIRSHIGDEESEMDLSKKQGSASGGEKQTPYFIVLAASLMQFYPKDVCCARIAFIDEAFSALSKERIEQMVKFLEDNNFQVFYAAPPEKINSIGQHIENTVSLYTQGKYTKPVEGSWH
ncbi:MAG: SbcC/MukB-like Walker B domain-containing protein [Treponema sp.]|nr:SbcC/MukB-like Walker B domain-containing protein [Treponema sp.]